MRTSVLWLNDYLDRPADAAEQAAALTSAGLPLDGDGTADNGEAWQEIETTSNRGDCLCHVGMAREVAAVTGRAVRMPKSALPSTTGDAANSVRVRNHEPALCPRYTARVIRGVKVGPSPEWLQRRLVAIGQIPRNNVVDATNFVLFELGQPTHVFDLATLAGSEIHIRRARDGEAFLPLGADAAEVKLTSGDLVIADRDRPVALAGVKGGALASVTDATTDLVLEAATFDAVSVRTTSRRHGIASDSSYRFERIVHPSEIDAAAERLASLIVEIAGGTLEAGVVADGAPLPAARPITLRPARARQILGFDIPTARMVELLDTLGFAPRVVGSGADERIETTAPARRVDVEREIDLIEEICRLNGLDAVPVADAIAVRVPRRNPIERATRDVKDLLVGMGFVETITHSLVSEKSAEAFLPSGAKALRVDDERAGGEPALRPSVVTSLLRVRRHNEDQGAANLRLFEFASAFHFDRRRGAGWRRRRASSSTAPRSASSACSTSASSRRTGSRSQPQPRSSNCADSSRTTRPRTRRSNFRPSPPPTATSPRSWPTASPTATSRRRFAHSDWRISRRSRLSPRSAASRSATDGRACRCGSSSASPTAR